MKVTFTKRVWPWDHRPLPAGRGLKIGPVVYTWPAVIVWLAAPLICIVSPWTWLPLFMLYYVQWLDFDRAGRASMAAEVHAKPVVKKTPIFAHDNRPKQPTMYASGRASGWYEDPKTRNMRYWDGVCGQWLDEKFPR